MEWVPEFTGVWPGKRMSARAPLSALTAWGVGGPADLVVQPANEEETERAVRLAVELGIPCRILGWGSNLLVNDQGIRGLVIRPSAGFSALEIAGDSVTAEMGVGLPVLARECARRGLSGMEFAIGIPGSLGGAVATNAGAEGSQMADVLAAIRVVRRSGVMEVRDARMLRFRYRHSALLEEPALVVSATLQLTGEEPGQVSERTRAVLEKRRRQPKGRSCGSVFRNPEGGSAGRLLEKVGAKGMRCGGARVPGEHANFVLAEGKTSASDILDLMRTLQERVLDETGTLLEPEVMFAGFEEGDPALPRGARVVREIT